MRYDFFFGYPIIKTARPQFKVRTLLMLTAAFACGLTFATQQSGWLVALIVTILLANVVAVIIALFVYVLLPRLEKNRPATSEQVDAE